MAYALHSLLAFAICNLICWPVLPLVAHAVAPVATGLWNLVDPHGQSLQMVEVVPRLRWEWGYR